MFFYIKDILNTEDFTEDASIQIRGVGSLSNNAPLWVVDGIMESEQLHEVGSTAFSVNVNTVDVVMLKEALSKAIEEEKGIR